MHSESVEPQGAPPEGGTPAFAPEQELRLAVVLYGGVSLAIYMYGVAQELFNLVWATAPSRSYADDGEPPPDLARGGTESTDTVYRRLGRLLPFEPGGGDGAAGPVRTRFVVDIVAGTSAGGINGVCLAKALAEEAELAQLKNIWLKEGDIGVLINDEDCGYPEAPPASLLSGRRMLDKLIAAIAGMEPAREGPSRLVDELDLWVTATDLEGLEIPIQLANATTTERRHGNRYHFRYSVEDGRDDFDGEADGFIAYAARSTSAFPFAFAPVLLEDLRSLDRVPYEAWTRFDTAYASAPPPEFARRAFSDGGILDNKPFSYATDTLLNRNAALPVDRKVVYVEPSPAGGSERRPRESWNAIDTTQAALLGLPQLENIREDVQTVLARNRTIERVRDIVAHAGSTAPEQARLDELASQPTIEDWSERGLSETPRQDGPAYGVYHRLKVRGVVDYLASLVVRAADLDPGSDDAFAVHYLVRAWKESKYASEPDDQHASENEFLLHFDVPYRLRRVNFLLERVNELRSPEVEVVRRVLEACGVDDPEPVLQAEARDDVLIDLRRELGAARRRLRAAERALVARDGPLAQALSGLGIGRDNLTYVLEGLTDEAMLSRAGEVVQPESFDSATEQCRAALSEAAARLRADVDALLQVPPGNGEPESTLRRALRFAYDTFEAYDLPLYLVQYGTPVGETNPVDIVRVSPLEAEGPSGATRDLKGLRLHHFGAFLDEDWRRHDMVWGRLDGAECLIRALLPEDPATAGELVQAAHLRILEEYCEEVSGQADGDVFEWFGSYPVADDPDEEPTTRALNRGAVVMSAVVENALPERGGGGAAREVVQGVRTSLIERDDAPAVDAVMGLVRSRIPPAAVAVWAVPLIAGIVFLFLGGGWTFAGCALLGLAAGFALVAIGVRVAVGGAVRGALAAARRAAYATFFPKRHQK